MLLFFLSFSHSHSLLIIRFLSSSFFLATFNDTGAYSKPNVFPLLHWNACEWQISFKMVTIKWYILSNNLTVFFFFRNIQDNAVQKIVFPIKFSNVIKCSVIFHSSFVCYKCVYVKFGVYLRNKMCAIQSALRNYSFNSST